MNNNFTLEIFNNFLDDINRENLKWVKESFKMEIKKVVDDFFPNLNKNDREVLKILVIFIVDLISYKYGFLNDDKNYENYKYQWIQNNFKDLKGVILLILPFIDDKNNGELLKELEDLNYLLYSYKDKKNRISSSILEKPREEILSTHFKFGNMGLGLINEAKMNLQENDVKLIYKIIYHNFIGLLQTLEIINGKSYINWINIVPLNLNNYNKSNIYLKTIENINEIKTKNENDFINLVRKNLISYQGLWIGDYYNILRNRYYEDSKIIKWLIFPYETNKKGIYLVNGLNNLINLENVINSNYNNYDDLPKNIQIEFTKNLNKIIENLEVNLPINELIEIDIEILKYTLIYLINSYSQKDSIKGNLVNKFKLSIDDQIINDEENDEYTKDDKNKIKLINKKDIINLLISITKNHINHLWNHLKESLEKLINSAYGKYIFNKNKKNYFFKNIYNYTYLNENEKININLNLKNIYNISKSISHENLENWKLLNKNYLSLDIEEKYSFFEKILNKINIDNWINLKSNFKRQYYGVLYNYTFKMNEVINNFVLIIHNLIFEELITAGLLNKFVLNREITDKLLLPTHFKARKDKIKDLLDKNFEKNKNDWLDSYYYLTDDKFKNLSNIRLDKEKVNIDDEKYDELTYFKLISKDHEWPLYYAMDWISQISFFQHYIYHQILYITGATGQGKSTQVPKLLLYALKVIDYKFNGKVICTQPRVPPTVNNATRIAEELGLPIEQTSNISKVKTRINNYYIQFKYQYDNHINIKKLHSFLRIVTDGTLLEELKANPTLFQKINDKFINKNIYDIVIVDEAHEHNINMDLIIALTRQACVYNNTIRLIIVSATMDDDEPIYRQYFKYNNDNLLFPIKNQIFYPFNINNYYILPNSNFMDRRYHISPPGETTQYRVDEYYLDYNPGENEDDEKIKAKIAQEEGYRKVLEICNKPLNTVSGEILFFANGKKEIVEAVKYLNSKLPFGFIALPYYSELHYNYKNIIEKINVKISQIKNHKNNIHLEWDSEYVEDSTVPLGIYKRCIIIATNVAEASVTIPGLSYVIDNGYAKVNIFKSQINKSVLEVDKISESSRLQRKGRVGRIGDGEVYYIYKKNARKNIKPKYKITQEDVLQSLLSIMNSHDINDINILENENLNKLIVSKLINPNNFFIYSNILNFENYDCFTVKSGLLDIYKKNLVININNDLKYLYTNPEFYNEFFAWNNGQIFCNIIDSFGNFFLIHPLENYIKRNVLNKIIYYDFKSTNYIPKYGFRFILNQSSQRNLMVNLNSNLIYEDYFNKDFDNYIKTELSNKVLEIAGKINSKIATIPNIITLLSASSMNVLNEVYEILILLFTINYSINSLISENIKWDNFYEKFADIKINSDIIYLYNLITKFKNQFTNLLCFKIDSQDIQNILNDFYNNKLNEFIELSDMYNEPPKYFDSELWNKLSLLKNNGILKTEYQQVIKSNYSIKELFYKNIDKYKNDINKWCINNFISSKTIYNFLNNIIDFQLSKDNISSIETFKWTKSLESNFYKLLTTNTKEEKIIRSFIYGNPFNFTTQYNKSTFITNYNFEIFPVIFGYNKFYNNPETLCKISPNLVFYLDYQESDKYKELFKKKNNNNNDNNNNNNYLVFNTKILNSVDLKWLIAANPLYMNPIIKKNLIIKTGIQNNLVRIFYFNSLLANFLNSDIFNYWNNNYLVWVSDDVPLLSKYYKNIFKIISTNINSNSNSN